MKLYVKSPLVGETTFDGEIRSIYAQHGYHGKVNMSPMHLKGGNCEMTFEGQTLQEIGKWTENLRLRKKMESRGWSVPALRQHTCKW